jgi:hypothetical protein
MMHPSTALRVFSRTCPALLLSLACVLGVAGCGGDSTPSAGSMRQVKGKVTTKDMTALNGLKIEFIPNSSSARPARAEIKPDGTFELTSKDSGGSEVQGVAEGEYHVRLDRGGPLPKGKTSPIPSQYFDEDGAFLSASIKSDTTELPPFDLKPIVGADAKQGGR